MVDQDLSGDDLKLVRYRIVYTKRDEEKLLCVGDDLVNYSTTLGDYGGRKTPECVENWEKEHPKEEPLDSKYIRTFVEVLDRFPKQEEEYDREKVHVLREIRDRI